MVSPTVAAAGISAAGSIVGGLLGKSKASSKPAYNSVMGAARAAKELGLHPLTVVGGGGYSGSVGGGSAIGNGIAAAGDALASGITGAARDKRNSRLDARQDKVTEAEIARLQSETNLNAVQAIESRSRTALNQANALAIAGRAKSGVIGGGMFGDRIAAKESVHLGSDGKVRGVEVVPEQDVPVTNTMGVGDSSYRIINGDQGADIWELIGLGLQLAPQFLADLPDRISRTRERNLKARAARTPEQKAADARKAAAAKAARDRYYTLRTYPRSSYGR